MGKKMLIDATHAEETRVVVVDGNKVEEFDFESENKRQLAGNIYLAKVTRVEPSLQAAFVDYGGNRHGFLAFSEIHPDYYQIPVADREALMEEERAYAEAQRARDEAEENNPKPRRSRRRSSSKAADMKSQDAVETKEVDTPQDSKPENSGPEISGMETIDLTEDSSDVDPLAQDVPEGSSPMETVRETPVEEPAEEAETDAADTAETPAEDTGEDSAEDAAEEATQDEAPAEVAEETAQAAAHTGSDSDASDDEAEADTPAAQDAQATSEDAPAEGADKADDKADDKAEDEAEDEAEDDSEDDKPKGRRRKDAASKDTSIESVADDDDQEDIRPARKPRPRRYKIQEVIKVRQVLLVQVVKEERGNKGAALTTYLSLAGRYCVLMPNTARGGGISRKITNAADRKKLKEIAGEIDVPTGAGLIIRTAGAKRTKTEIKRDYEYLKRMWEQIRELTLKSIAPTKIYEEGDLIKRSIRDLYSREIDEVLVEGERGYRIAKDFMKMIMPSHAKNVKKYEESLPLFARYQVESYLSSMFNPTVQLKSGGYIVIGVTEALVAIDVNSGRATKEGSIEETALKTNLEAAEEVARQLRLRDLAGLIVIDFIDMDERKNNAAVEKRMKDKLKTDRARIQVGRISGFGLMEMSRQRLRPGMIEATTQPCPSCHGTGLIRSDDNMALSILRQIEEEGTRGRSREVLVRCPVSIANYLMNQKREHIAYIESRYGLSVRIEGDVHLVSPDFTLEKFKTATRVVPEPAAAVVSVDTKLMEQIDADVEEAEEVSAEATPEEGGEEQPKPKRKRRRRRRSKKSGASQDNAGAEGETSDAESSTDTKPANADETSKPEDAAPQASPSDAAEAVAEAGSDEKPADPAPELETAQAPESDAEPAEVVETVTDLGDADTGTRDELAGDAAAEEAPVEPVEPVEDVSEAASGLPADETGEVTAEAPAPEDAEPSAKSQDPEEAEPVAEVAEVESEVSVVSEATAEPVSAEAPAEPVAVLDVATEVVEQDTPPKPKKRGWWSLG
jgi:ribonuclease E